MIIKPLNQHLVIIPSEMETVTRSGIYIPEMAKEEKTEGIVHATGDDSIVQVGDRVVYKKWAADEFKLDDQRMMLVKEDDLVAVIES